MSSGRPQVTTGFVPFKICSHTIIQKFANPADTFMPFSAICDVHFATPSHILNEYNLLFYYICTLYIGNIYLNLQSQLSSLQTFTLEAQQIWSVCLSVITQYCSVSSLHWLIAIYHNSMQQWAHKKDNSIFYQLYIQPPTTKQCFTYCERIINNLTYIAMFQWFQSTDSL